MHVKSVKFLVLTTINGIACKLKKGKPLANRFCILLSWEPILQTVWIYK